MTDNELVRVTRGAELDLATFEAALLQRLEDARLPSQAVLVSARQRMLVFGGMDEVLERISDVQKMQSLYLSKFFAAVAAGLFDAALNYLWDETVEQLRKRVSAYDINYFYDLAVGPTSDARKKLSTPDDLSRVEDQKLIQAANRMGLLSDVSLQQIDLVRYMRNHASAAHPNHVELRAFQLLNFLETCIIEVITMQVDASVLEIKRLLENVKKEVVEKGDIPLMKTSFETLPQDQADNLGNGLFGIYTRIGVEEQVKENVRLLMPTLWPFLSEATHQQFGVRTSRFKVNHEKVQAQAARELLETVDAISYLSDDIRVPEIDAALDDLHTAHSGWDNFTNEIAPAKRLAELVGQPPAVPEEISNKYVDTVVWVFLTNGAGPSWGGEPIYTELLKGMTAGQAAYALTIFTEQHVANRLNQKLSGEKFQALLELIDGKIVGRPRRDLLKALQEFPGTYSRAKNDSSIKKLLAAI